MLANGNSKKLAGNSPTCQINHKQPQPSVAPVSLVLLVLLLRYRRQQQQQQPPTKKRTKAHAKCREETLGIREKEEEENNNYARQLFSIFNECDVKPHHQLISSSFFLFPPLFPPPTEGERKKRKKKSNKTRKPQKHGVGSRQSCVLLCCV
jgi:hypothetical protein